MEIRSLMAQMLDDAYLLNGTETSTTYRMNLHPDKYNDPRVKITRRGLVIAFAVVLLGIIGSAASIYLRRTHLEETARFWGAETITALQLAERIELLSRGQESFDPIDLAGTPGLGHLRHRLLDDRNFDWTTESPTSAMQDCGPVDPNRPGCIQLRFTDPTAQRIGTVLIDLDLEHGWVGPSDGSRRVRVTDWVQPKLQNYFKTIRTVEQKRYDQR
jgi:hypothetical protein